MESKANEFIKKVHEETLLLRKSLLEDRSPQVGVFYYINGKIYARTRPVYLLKRTQQSGVISYSTHFSFWYETLRHDHPEWNGLPDWHFPRGRVIYDIDHDMYFVCVDKCVPPEKISKVMAEVNLGRLKNVKVQRGKDPKTGTDHYKCASCDSELAPKVL